MKQLYAKHATIEFITQTSLLASIIVSLFYTIPWKTPLSVTFARYKFLYYLWTEEVLFHSFYSIVLIVILQERRALLFCQQDRALLCRECDIPVHKANQHTQKHDRFLLTGVRLSASSSANQTPSSSTVSYAAGSTRTAKTESKSASSVNDPHNLRANSTAKTSKSTSNHLSFEIESHWTNQEGSVATSSISEYLTETLPGWHVEDFLDPPSSFPYGLQHSCFFFFLFLFYNILSWWWNGVMLIQKTWQYSH